MTSILAVDPGSERSAWLVLDGDRIASDDADGPLYGIVDNETLLEVIRRWHDDARIALVPLLRAVVIEDIEPRQQPLGREVADTLRWIGRYMEAAHPVPVTLLPRRVVARHLCDGPHPGDPEVRGALLDRWGGKDATRKGGPLHGVVRDLWSALALAVTWADLHGGGGER